MAVSNESIMKQMKVELQQATAAVDDSEKWIVHIAHIKLLSELLLNEQRKIETQVDNLKEPTIVRSKQATTNIPEQDEDSSIFDF